MWYAINFDILFGILLIGMVFSAVFKKSGKLTFNFILFLLTSTAIGLLVYFKIDERIFNAISGSLQPIFASVEKFLNKEVLYGAFYFGMLLIIDIILFLVIKLIVLLFANEHHKFKADVTYTPKHNGIAAFLTSILKFALVLNILLIIIDLTSGYLGLDLSNSYVIYYFREWEKPLLDLIKNKGYIFFKTIGY